VRHRSPARSRRLTRRPRQAQALPPAAIDRPSATEPASGRTLEVVGWTWPFEGERVRRVELSVEGTPAGNAHLTLRPDISETLGRPEAILSGFEATIDLAGAASAHEIALSLEVHGLDGGAWAGTGWRFPIAPAVQAEESQDTAATVVSQEDPTKLTREHGPRDGAWPATTALDGPDRDWIRRRLGYDPPHVVVLVANPVLSAGSAIAALDVLAESRPNLELIIPNVRSDSYIANLISRAVRTTGLEDRVTVPFVPPPAAGWSALTDLELTRSVPGAAGDDLEALIDTLDAACAAR
jgi:hypothetical protein